MCRCLELQAHWDSSGRSGEVQSNFRNISSNQQMFYLPSTQSTVIKGLNHYSPDLNNANKLWEKSTCSVLPLLAAVSLKGGVHQPEAVQHSRTNYSAAVKSEQNV